ncbi:hypothetical protein M9Y10_007246 [Tritrichomonas musculus]|uniref:Uncharacterized protein n=1 Tax=Tritrichomonas musculus TaxID=1915356 RepID=A0ABR2J1N0_9EUKA
MIGFFFAFSTCALQNCRLSAENVAGVQTMKDLFSIKCNNILLTNITSASSSEPFLEINEFSEMDNDITVTFTNCDFSKSSTLAYYQTDQWQNTVINARNTLIGGGFKRNSNIVKVLLENCLINLTMISENGNTLSNQNVIFKKCKFVGSNSMFNSALFNYFFHLGYDEFNVEFIDCEFNLDENWNSYDSHLEAPSKQFIVINNPAMFTVNISFIRCFTSNNFKDANYKFIKISNLTNNEDNVRIVGEDNSFPIQWSTVSSEDDLFKESDWEILINSTDYIPTQEPSFIYSSNNTPADSGEGAASGNSNKSKTWMIVAIVFMAAFVVAIVALVIVLVLKRKKYDRSENE